MNFSCRKLLWEQWRTAGVLSVYISGIVLLLLFGLKSAVLNGQLHVMDLGYGTLSYAFYGLLVLAMALLVRQDGHGHLAMDFEPRLLHFPVYIGPVVVIVFAARLFFLVVSAAVIFGAMFILFGQTPPVTAFSAAIHLYLGVQAFSWSRKSITGLIYSVPTVLLLCAGLAALWGVGVNRMVGIAGDCMRCFTHPLSLTVVFPLCAAFACFSVFLRRCDIRFGPPPVSSFFRWLSEFRAARARTFTSAFDAQLWFEQRRFGRLLPGLTLVFTLAFGLLFTLAPQTAFDIQSRYALAPFFGLMAAALICGRIGLRPRSRFAFHQAQTTTHLSLAILCIQLRAMFLCFLLVSGLAFLGLLLSGHDGFLLLRMLKEGDLDWIGAAALMLRPAIAFTLIAWVMLWISTLPMLLPVLTTLGVFWVFLLDSWLTVHQDTFQGNLLLIHRLVSLEVREIMHFVETNGLLCPAAVMLLIVSLLALAVSVKFRLVTRLHFVVFAVLWQNLTLLLIAASPALPLNWLGIISCPVAALFILLPLIAAPVSLFHHNCNG